MSLTIPRWLKKSFIAVTAIVAAVFIGLFIYVKTLDLNRYADLIDSKIESATGRDFRAGNWFFGPLKPEKTAGTTEEGALFAFSGINRVFLKTRF